MSWRTIARNPTNVCKNNTHGRVAARQQRPFNLFKLKYTFPIAACWLLAYLRPNELVLVMVRPCNEQEINRCSSTQSGSFSSTRDSLYTTITKELYYRHLHIFHYTLQLIKKGGTIRNGGVSKFKTLLWMRLVVFLPHALLLFLSNTLVARG